MESIQSNSKRIANYKGKIVLNSENFDRVLPKIKLNEYPAQFGNGICTICFEEYNENHEYRILPCQHVFHYECIFTWLIENGKKKCPNDNFTFR